jgi:ankyrin repeat protein
MNALEQQVTARDLINALETLPSNIDDIYNSVFNRISSQRLASTLEKLLIVVATARKLLSTEALAHAITVQQDDDDVDELAIPDVRHLASMCSGLIVIDPFGYVRLVHETIGDYIGKTGLKQSKSGHTMLAELCLIYLQFSAFSSGACGGPEREVLLQERQLKYPFLRYAATHWGVHTQLAYVNGPSFLGTDILGGMAGKLMSKSENVAAATQFMWLDDIETSSGWDAEENVHGLHLSAYFGLTDTVSNLLATDVNADVDVQDCLQTTPLMYAAQAGHADIVRLLLHTGADPGRICRRGRTALHRACERNYDAVVKEIVLSPKDVAVNAIDGGSYSLSALMWAVSNNNSNIIKHLLLRNDIDVNLKRPNQNKLNAFHQCVVKGQIDNAKLLLSDGRVMIESMSSSRETALPLAVRRGYDEMVALLLEWGADADTRDIYDGPPLLRAADENSLECVRILVEHGVDYQFRDFHGRGILHGCANHGRSTIMRYLLENLKDLDPNTQGDRGETPLHDAVFRNTEAVARVLLEYGARTDIRDRHGKTPLRMARDANLDKLFDLLRSARLKEIEAVKHAQQSIRPDGEAELVEQLKRTDTLAEDYKISIEAAVQSLSGNELETYLDEMGADAVGAINDPTRELLQTIIMSQQFHNLRILLDRGADINSRDKWGYTPLHAAIHTSQYETAEFLLDRGCNINQRDLLNRSPLTFCTTWNFMPVIAFLLLKRGATFNGPERDSLVPMLSYAVDCDEFDVVKILVEGGVPFRNKDTRGLTPYQRAKQAGHERIAQYIYEQARKGRSKPQDSKQVAGEVAHDPIEETSKESSGVAEDEVPTHEDGQRGDTTKSKERIDEKHGISSLQDRLGMTRRETGLLSIIIMLMMLLLFK